MKNLLSILTILLFTSCSFIGVEGDEEAVLLIKPLFFGSGGVDDEPVSAGRVTVAFTTDPIIFKVVPVAYSENFVNLISDDNVPLDYETHLTLQIRKGTTPELYKKFGTNWYKNNVSPRFRAEVRDKISSYKMQDLISNREILQVIDKDLTIKLNEYFKSINLPVEIINITIGAATPPNEVLEETQKTAAQNQSILTQLARAKAEDSRKQAEINKAIADRAYQKEMNMTTSEYLILRNIEIEMEKIEMVKSKNNVTIVMGQVPQTMVGVK